LAAIEWQAYTTCGAESSGSAAFRLAHRFDPHELEVEVFATAAVLCFEHQLDGKTGTIPVREVLQALKQRLKEPEKFQQHIERTGPLPDLHFAENLPQA